MDEQRSAWSTPRLISRFVVTKKKGGQPMYCVGNRYRDSTSMIVRAYLIQLRYEMRQVVSVRIATCSRVILPTLSRFNGCA